MATGEDAINLPPAVFAAFPRLGGTSHRATSVPSPLYNCIAWAAGEKNVHIKWWPCPLGTRGSFWPDSAPNKESVKAFEIAFRTLGYQPCKDANLVVGLRKVAIYAVKGRVKHMARQLPSGMWSSKLGEEHDIEHELGALEGSEYGRVVKFLARPG